MRATRCGTSHPCSRTVRCTGRSWAATSARSRSTCACRAAARCSWSSSSAATRSSKTSDPGTLERWDLGYDTLKAANPDIVLVRVSGYGQDGPYRDKAGFGTPAAAMGGLTYITGFPDRPPITVPIALADYLAGLFAALGGVAALLERERNREAASGSTCHCTSPSFDSWKRWCPPTARMASSASDSGNRTGQSSPIGSYRTADDRYMVLSVSTDRVWLRMTEAMGHPEWATDPRYVSNPERTKRPDEVDALVGGWFAEHTAEEAQRLLDAAGVPVSPIYSIADIFEDAAVPCAGRHHCAGGSGGRSGADARRTAAFFTHARWSPVRGPVARGAQRPGLWRLARPERGGARSSCTPTELSRSGMLLLL